MGTRINFPKGETDDPNPGAWYCKLCGKTRPCEMLINIHIRREHKMDPNKPM